jgi:WD40 repeat protein
VGAGRAGDDGGAITLWSLPEFRRLGDISGHSRGVSDLHFTSDGKILVSASSDEKTLRLWTVPEGNALACFGVP